MAFPKQKPHLSVPAICIYSPFIRQAKQQLAGSGIHVATVACCFPSGQMPFDLKVKEVEYCVNEGADEVDMVISRGTFLAGRYDEVFDEIKTIKETCGNKARLKVILETGELKTVENIRKASELAILAGADFIKTSTGKVPVAATPLAASPDLLWNKLINHKTHKTCKTNFITERHPTGLPLGSGPVGRFP